MPSLRACFEATSKAGLCLVLGAVSSGAAAKELPTGPTYQSLVFSGKADPTYRYEVRALDAQGELLSSFPVYTQDGSIFSGDTLRVDGAVAIQTGVWMSDELLALSEPEKVELTKPFELKLPEGLGGLALVPANVSVSEVQVTEELRRYDFNLLDSEGRQLPVDAKLVQWDMPFGPPDVMPEIPKPPIKCPNAACVFLPLRPKERLTPVLTACLGPLCGSTSSGGEEESGPTGWKSIGVGSGFTCGLTHDGRVLCWGEGMDGQLGYPPSGPCVLPFGAPTTAKCAWTPKQIVQPSGSLTAFQALDVGESHACAIDTSGALWCWGKVTKGPSSACPGGAAQCGPFRLIPNDPSAPNTAAHFATVSAGGHHTCAVTNAGSLVCFGSNLSGEAGGSDAAVFNSVGPVGFYDSVSAGRNHTCALTKTGRTECWGRTIHLTRLPPSVPQADRFLGFPEDIMAEHPAIGAGVSADLVSAGNHRTCIHAVDGTLSCLDELNTTNFRWSVEQISTVTTDLEASLTDESKCEVESGKLFCDLPQSAVRHTHLPFTTDVADSSVEFAHGCAVESNGTAWCWGDNTLGQLGDGSQVSTDPSKPVAVLQP